MSENNKRMSDEESRALDARFLDYEARGIAAQARAAQAYARLLLLAETRDSGQIRRIVQFLASTYNSTAFPWDPFDLRSVDVATLADKLAAQKEQRDLEGQRDKKRRELFDRQDEIQRKRDGLIDELERQLKQEITVSKVLACEWELI